jgi:hypothetical protein
MNQSIITEAFLLTIHVMAQRPDWSNYNQDFVRGHLCDNQNDVDAMVSGTGRFSIRSVGALSQFENNSYSYDNVSVQDYVSGPVAKARFGRPSSNVETIGIVSVDEWGNDVYGTIHSQGVSNLDFSDSEPYTLAVTSPDIYSVANHFAGGIGLTYSWYYAQQGPMPSGSTTKAISVSYVSGSAVPINYSATHSFPLLDYEYYDTTYPPNMDAYTVYVNVPSVTIPNSAFRIPVH